VSSLTVNVRDVNEAPTFGTLPTGYSVPEESGAGVVVTPTVGTFITVADQDGGNASALTVTVASSAWGFSSNYFEVVRSSDFAACVGGDTCILRVRTGSPRMDYDAGLVRVNVTVTVADSNGLRMTTPNFTVTIVDINQGAFALRRYVAAWGCVVSRSGSGQACADRVAVVSRCAVCAAAPSFSPHPLTVLNVLENRCGSLLPFLLLRRGRQQVCACFSCDWVIVIVWWSVQCERHVLRQRYRI
jgi:hypothetical protein